MENMEQDQERRTPIDVQKYLEGIDYPASKQDIISHAQDRGADDDTLNLIDQLPDKEYEDPTEVSKEMGGVEG